MKEFFINNLEFFRKIFTVIFSLVCPIGVALLILKNIREKIYLENRRLNKKKESFSQNVLPSLKNKNNLIEFWKDNSGIENFKLEIKPYKLIYIVGCGGSGKSTLTNYIYNELWNKKCNKIKALYIPIKKLEEENKNMFNYVYKNFRTYCKSNREKPIKVNIKTWKQLLESLTQHNYLYIFVDGYDEIVYNKMGFDLFDDEIREILNSYNEKVKLIISSRYEPRLYVDTSFMTFEVEELTDEQKDSYLDYDEASSVNKDIITNPLLLTMYASTKLKNEIPNTQDDIYIKDIKTATDIYWNYYCYNWNKIKTNSGKEDAKVVFIKYILPFIAYNLERKIIENRFTMRDIKKYTEEYKKNFDCFKEIFGFDCTSDDIIKLISEANFESYLLESGIVEIEGTKKYKFTHLMQKNFYAALYEYYKDQCILETDYSKHGVVYQPYEDLDEKVTIHTITRVFYSNLVARLISNKDPSYFLNAAKYYCILSDLHYYGDSILFEQDKNKALIESIRGYNYFNGIDNNNIDVLSKKWLAWNLSFIIFSKLLEKSNNEKYTDEDIKNAKYAINSLKSAMDLDYAPAYDKFAKIYTSKLFERFKEYNILTEKDIPQKGFEIDKAKELLLKACKKGYHYACNNYAVLLEKEGKINEAFEYFQKSVKSDPLEFYAISRCCLYLIHNYNNLVNYAELPNNKLEAYIKADEYMKNGYTYYSAIQYDKPYEIQGIKRLMSNLAEFSLIMSKKENEDKKILKKLKDSYEYYCILFHIYDTECNAGENTYKKIFASDDVVRDLLCFCLVYLRLSNTSKEKVSCECILTKRFYELCEIVYNHFEALLEKSKNNPDMYPFKYHPIFHIERFKKYYEEFKELYKKE